MTKEELLEMVKTQMGEIPKVVEHLTNLDTELMANHFAEKKNAYSGDRLDKKTKAMIAMAVGVALDSQSCIFNNLKAAKQNGASIEEIMEAFKVAKFSKGASSISSSAAAFEWLVNNK
jgi:alkylhydroperoxidase/carboxymuconolactone decarboxylase family protein YurZ